MSRGNPKCDAEGRWLLGLSVFLMITFAALPQSATADALHEVKVSFVHDAQEFVFPMDEVETLAQELVVTQLGKAFGFLKWTAEEQTDSPAAEWTVKLRQEAAGSGLRIWLEHHVKVDDSEFELPQILEHKLLYDLGNVIPAQSPSRLRGRIEEKLHEQLNGDFLNVVEVEFLRRIQLTDDILAEGEADPPRLVVPLRLKAMKATTDSMIGVRLKINGRQYGKLILKALNEVPDGECEGCVHGRIHEFEVPPIDNLILPMWWHESLPDVISRAQTKEIYMHHYSVDLAGGASTRGGNVLEPDG